jgi:hypothetical protein
MISYRRGFLTCCSLAILLFLGGCSSKQNSVSGKVTLNGKAVTGQVAFLSADGQERIAPIDPDGSYRIINPQPGEVKVVVRGFNMPRPYRTGMKLAPLPAGTLSSGPTTALAPPARYAWPANGLTFTVTGGAQTFDIPLVP